MLPFKQRQTRTIVGDDVVWGAGGHSIKFGVEYERQTTFVNLPLFGDGSWTFPSLTAFLQNQPSLFLGALPGATDAARNIEEWRITSYVQDEWRLGNRFTLNLGLRYDPRGIPTLDKAAALVDLAQSTGFTPITEAFSRNPTLNNWEPRVGVAFDPFSGSEDVDSRRLRHLPQPDHRQSSRACLRAQPAVRARRAGASAVPAGAGLSDAEPGRVADFADAGTRLRHGGRAAPASVERQRAARVVQRHQRDAGVRRAAAAIICSGSATRIP